MIELVVISALILVIFSLVGLIGWLDWNNRKERAKLLNALLAKTPEQFRDLEFVDKVQPASITPPEDLIPMNQLSDEDFAEKVGQQYG